jgi:hypothetical protein
MTTYKRISHPAWMVAYVLGQTAIWWGTLVAALYVMGFAILLPQSGRIASGINLPWEVPAIGLGLGGLGLSLAHRCGQPARGAALVGVLVNAVPLALALWLSRG